MRIEKNTGYYDAKDKLDTPPAELLSLIPGPTAFSEMEICSLSPNIASQIHRFPYMTTEFVYFVLDLQQQKIKIQYTRYDLPSQTASPVKPC